MKQNKIDPTDMKTLIADYMEKGFLENIIDMFKHDASLYAYIGDLMRDERLIVRIGLSALVETLSKEDPENMITGIPFILPLLKEQNSVLRSDAAYFLGMIGQKDALPHLREAALDEDETVRTIAKESIEEIESTIST